jgi:hypothetical protein
VEIYTGYGRECLSHLVPRESPSRQPETLTELALTLSRLGSRPPNRPYALYEKIDLVYSPSHFARKEGFTSAQSLFIHYLSPLRNYTGLFPFFVV